MNRTYNTKQAKAILACLQANAERHLTAEEIYKLLSLGEQPVGLTTIYRNLEKFLKKGIIIKYDTGGEACFQLVGSYGQNAHYHFVCTECGGLKHTECKQLDELFSHFTKDHNFDFNRQKTIFYGKCESCK